MGIDREDPREQEAERLEQAKQVRLANGQRAVALATRFKLENRVRDIVDYLEIKDEEIAGLLEDEQIAETILELASLTNYQQDLLAEEGKRGSGYYQDMKYWIDIKAPPTKDLKLQLKDQLGRLRSLGMVREHHHAVPENTLSTREEIVLALGDMYMEHGLDLPKSWDMILSQREKKFLDDTKEEGDFLGKLRYMDRAGYGDMAFQAWENLHRMPPKMAKRVHRTQRPTIEREYRQIVKSHTPRVKAAYEYFNKHFPDPRVLADKLLGLEEGKAPI